MLTRTLINLRRRLVWTQAPGSSLELAMLPLMLSTVPRPKLATTPRSLVLTQVLRRSLSFLRPARRLARPLFTGGRVRMDGRRLRGGAQSALSQITPRRAGRACMH